MPIGRQQDMAMSRSGDGFMPMTGANDCRWTMRGGLPMVMKKNTEVVNRLVALYRSVAEGDLMLSIVIGVCFGHGFCLI